MIPILIGALTAAGYSYLARRYYRSTYGDTLAKTRDTVVHALAIANILLTGVRVPKQAIKDLRDDCEKVLDVGPELAAELVRDSESFRKKQNPIN